GAAPPRRRLGARRHLHRRRPGPGRRPGSVKEKPVKLPHYAADSESHPPNSSEPYRSSVLRAPHRPLQLIPQHLTEITGPLLGADRLGELDHDLTRQHAGEPLGERIIVTGRLLVSSTRPVPNTLLEVWQ